jgi:hypothetical protein
MSAFIKRERKNSEKQIQRRTPRGEGHVKAEAYKPRKAKLLTSTRSQESDMNGFFLRASRRNQP